MLRRILTHSPVNRSHPLAYRRKFWAAGFPWRSGGRALYDEIADAQGSFVGTGTTWTSRPGGLAALTFNSNGHVDFGNLAVCNAGLGDISFGAWYKNTNGIGSILAKSIAASAPGRWALYLDNSGTINATFSTTAAGGQAASWSNAAVNDGTWRFAVGTVARAGNITIYVDGVSRATASVGGGTAEDLVTTYPVWVGRYPASDGVSVFGSLQLIGSVSEPFFYNRALSAAEVWALYDETRRNYPTLANREPSRVSFLSPSATPKFRRSLHNRTGSRGAV